MHFFLGNCINDEILCANGTEDKLLTIYHNEFVTFTKKLGVRATEEIGKLNFALFQEEYEEYRYYGILDSILMLQFVYANSVGSDHDNENRWLKRLKNIINIQIPKLLSKYSAVNK